MPKYIPTNNDVYSTKPCAICGNDVLDEGSETCCEFCEQQWQGFKEDYEFMMLQDWLRND